MRKPSLRGSLIRGMSAACVIAVGCNAILGNEDRSIVASTSGGESGSGGADSTTGSGGSSSGGGGNGGTTGNSGGAAGAGEAGAAGAAGAAGSGRAGAAGESSEAGTDAATTVSSTSSTTASTSTTGSDCECTPGHTGSRQRACGNCGTALETRLCNENCRWGEFEAGECSNQGTCAPGTPDARVGHCTNGRWRDDTRTCGDDCEWGPWVGGECQGNAENCTGCACVAWCTDPDTGGTTCKWIACSEAEAREECEADIVATGCTRKEPLTFEEWLPN